ncbi:hypothetical protein SAMN04487819_10933 [Actinopolyspora alba]|uniref:Uncharacterized protein n=1 Tax=Actinopolyspora alba TaxID=673379 RepID=A0A1I1YI68_9ACTN|nr:hypothetical protein SAMN04487819_10933 [Actinopolyspora alba]
MFLSPREWVSRHAALVGVFGLGRSGDAGSASGVGGGAVSPGPSQLNRSVFTASRNVCHCVLVVVK